jgi:hypothetical protein
VNERLVFFSSEPVAPVLLNSVTRVERIFESSDELLLSPLPVGETVAAVVGEASEIVWIALDAIFCDPDIDDLADAGDDRQELSVDGTVLELDEPVPVCEAVEIEALALQLMALLLLCWIVGLYDSFDLILKSIFLDEITCLTVDFSAADRAEIIKD